MFNVRGIRPPELPLYVLVEFDKYRGKCIHKKGLPITPISNLFMKSGMKCNRKQSPLVLGHAFSIHKAQGLTLDKVKFYFKLKMLRYLYTQFMLY